MCLNGHERCLPSRPLVSILENQRTISAGRCGLDGARMPVERAVVDGRVGRADGGRGGLPRPRPGKPGRSGVSALRPARAPRRGSPGMEPVRHAAIADRLREGLRGRFWAAHAHFGVDTGCRIAPDRRSPVSEGVRVAGKGGARQRARRHVSSDGPPVAIAVFEADGQEAGETCPRRVTLRMAAVPGVA